MKLLIVESPGKVKKIQGFLGNDFKVMASVGHVRELPPKTMGVAPPDFTPHYEPTERGKDVLKRIAAAVKQANEVFLATDPDREGEAIAWHLADALKLTNPKRVTFTEITENAVKDALATPRIIDLNLVRAQEGRRVLDRLVGYLVSPVLTTNFGLPVSAGRVQSPALRLVVEREEAIEAFNSTTHFGAEFTFEAMDNATSGWQAVWNCKNWLEDGQEYFLDKSMVEHITTLRDFTVTSYAEKESKQAPPAPFTTSSLQQVASNTLKFSSKRTMELAQKLYEAGAITYMRTDSPNLSDEAIAEIRGLASENDWPVPTKPRTWPSKDGAQEAHEAIRPTHLRHEDAGSTDDEKALYTLIRNRAFASQLDDAISGVVVATLESELDGKKVILEAKGRRLIAPGWRVLSAKGSNTETNEEDDSGADNPLPKLREGSHVLAASGKVLAKKTKPPARFSEASLIGALEKMGLGRPSTYANILENILGRKCLKLEKNQLVPTELGRRLIKLLNGKFDFLDYNFTKNLEGQLDEIAAGKADYRPIVSELYEILCKEVDALVVASGLACPECGRILRHIVRPGKYNFWSCSGYATNDCQATFKDVDGKPGAKSVKKQ